MKIKIAIAAALVATTVAGAADAKKKPQVSSLELQQMQSREFEVPKDVAFAAVMTVLQDSGYRIGAADRDTGLITGAASTNTHTTWLPFVGFGKSKKTPVVSAYIEDRGPAISRVRFNFVMTKNSANQFGGSADEDPITDIAVYTDAFERLNKEVFVRVAMKGSPGVTAAGGAGVAQAAAPVAPVVQQTPTLTPAVATTTVTPQK